MAPMQHHDADRYSGHCVHIYTAAEQMYLYSQARYPIETGAAKMQDSGGSDAGKHLLWPGLPQNGSV